MRRGAIGVRRGAGAAALAAGLVLGGCSVLPGSGGPAPSEPSASSAAAPGPGATSAGQPTSSAAPSGSPSPSPGAVLGTKTFTEKAAYAPNKIKIRFDLLALQRRGDLLELRADLVNLSEDQSTDQRWQVGSRFNGSSASRDDLKATDGAFAGVVLTDLAQKKRYLVAADSAGDCVCTSNLSGTFPDAGETVELTATYAAPPASTTTVDVSVPELGTFRDVPIS